MTKSKNTKAYRNLASNYKDARWMVDFYERDIRKWSAELDKTKKHRESMTNIDEEVNGWYEAYVSMINTSISILRTNQSYSKADMEKYGKTLIENYDEDLELLYSEYLKTKK